MVGGPNYETVAELKFLRELGKNRKIFNIQHILIQIMQEWTLWA